MEGGFRAFFGALGHQVSPSGVRVPPNSYLSAMFIGSFFTGLLIYLRFDIAAGFVFVTSWLVVPLLFWTDRIDFDGTNINRTGILPRFWGLLNGSSVYLSIEDVELVETQALRALKRGGDVFYRYRTAVSGKGRRFVIVSGGSSFRKIVKELLASVSENVLDNRSIELRDYLCEPSFARLKAGEARIPSSEVLQQSKPAIVKKSDTKDVAPAPSNDAAERADELRQLANELRLSGYLLQSLEAFRRALRLNPGNGWLLFEFARCLHSYAGAERNTRLERKALAALRLAERRAVSDKNLLSRLGESYFQYGEWGRARKAFQKTLGAAGESFRSVKGLAELSLREGKIAHVIHHFAAADRLAETPALRRWAKAETEYFSRLNSDDDYMDLEIGRVNLLTNLERGKKTTMRIAILGFPSILFGFTLNAPLLLNLAWTVSCVSLLIWVGLTASCNLLSPRIHIKQDLQK